MLDKFRAAKAKEIDTLRQLEAAGRMPAPFAGKRPAFRTVLSRPGCAVIAEYKRASPSKGEINMHLTPQEVAALYKKSGAAAMSVLTEEAYFKGRLGYLADIADALGRDPLPLLRKDFLFDPAQIRATAATPASAILLIVRMFKTADELAAMRQCADDCGLDSVVEIFDPRDLDLARQAGADIIQVNSRDLDTLRTDTRNALDLVPRRLDSEIWISASGIQHPGDVTAMERAGYDAVLVGTSIMAAPDPADFLASLVRAGRPEVTSSPKGVPPCACS